VSSASAVRRHAKRANRTSIAGCNREIILSWVIESYSQSDLNQSGFVRPLPRPGVVSAQSARCSDRNSRGVVNEDKEWVLGREASVVGTLE
jgi:hypothetical protein